MTNTVKLIGFMLEKHQIIKAYTDINYLLKADIEELKQWPKTAAESFFNYEPFFTDDMIICPWCRWYRCDDCRYGLQHGLCSKEKSRYSKITVKIAKKMGIQLPFSAINLIPGIDELYEKNNGG